MHVIMRPAGEPRLDLGRLVGGIVIHDDMNIEPFRNLSIDLFQEVQKLGGAMSLVALADDKARGNIEGSEQRRCPVPYVIVRPTFGDARHHRQDRLFAVQGLDLAFLVDAENKRPVGWREVKSDDIAHLVYGSSDSLNVWLRCGCKPNAAHIRRIVVWEKPISAAIERIDQCVASVGVVRNVRSITAAT